MHSPSLARFAWLSIGAALLTISLKAGAYLLTGSVGLLSDALESGVNLIAAVVALFALSIAALPPDDEHQFGHSKVEYFSSGVEGALILVAAVTIIWSSVQRLLDPQPLEQVGLGLVVSLTASAVNLGVARLLLKAGQEHHSITLEADGHHLMTDVWTSVGVVVGVAAVSLTGIERLDPLIAILVGINIIWTGGKLLYRSGQGLLDQTIPAEEQAQLTSILEQYTGRGIRWHALRTRQAGARRFISVHLLVPDEWTVRQGHSLSEELEANVRQVLPNSTVITHLEPLGDPTSWQDTALDRPA